MLDGQGGDDVLGGGPEADLLDGVGGLDATWLPDPSDSAARMEH